MLTLTQNVVILIGTMAVSLLFMVGLNRFWPVQKRHTQNDLIGWQLSVLGTTYAVTLGFMLYTDWTNFNAAYLNAELEANSLRNIYRLAEGLPQQRTEIERKGKLGLAVVGAYRVLRHQEGVERLQIGVGCLGEMRIGKRGIEMAAVAMNAFAHRALESGVGPIADPGFGIRRDVG